MSSLTNIAINARSMNGLITISDGQGTTIEDGTIDTDSLTVDNFTVINMLVNYMSILRDSNPVVNAALGSTVDIGLLVQNMIFDDITRLYQVWDDTATHKIFEIDVSNNTVTFNNSTVSFPNSTVTVTGALTTNRFLLNMDSINSSTINWAFGDNQNIYLTASISVNFNLPLVTSSTQYGTIITIVTGNPITITFNAAGTNSFIDENNVSQSTKTYTSGEARIFSFMAISIGGSNQWRMMYLQVKNLLVTANAFTNTNSFSSTTTFTGNIVANSLTITPTELGYIDGVTSNIQTQLTAKAGLSTANAFTSTNSFSATTTFTGNIVANSLTITPTELGYIDGVTSSIQTQLNGKATLSTANAFTSTNSFSATTTFTGNIVANSLTITPTELGYIDGVTSSIQTQLNGKATLSGSNTFTNTNTFTSGSCIVTTQPENTNNTTAVSTAYVYRIIRGDSTLRNISIGQNANPANVSANNFALGYGALQNASATSSDCVALGINSLNALTTGYYCFGMGGGAMQFATTSTRCVALGYATFPNGNPTNSVCIGANSASVSNGSENIIFGCFTANSLSSGSSNFICGSSSAQVLTTGGENIMCGYNSGAGIITGSRNTLLGVNTSASSDFSNGCAIGYNAVINANNEIALGTSTETVKVYGNLVLENKLSLQSATVYNSASVNLSFGSSLNENIILQSNTVTDIYLPASYTDANLGCSFTVTRAYTPIITDDINFDTAGGAQFVSADFTIGPTSWFMDYSITTVLLTLTKISSFYTWVLSYTRRIAILADTTSNINYPVLFGPLSANSQEVFADSTNINYNPSTDTLNVNNISTTKPILEKQDTGVEVSTSTNVNADPTAGQYSLYKFCNMGVGVITYRLPTITASTVGWRFMVKRMYGSNMNVCTFNPSAFTTQPIIFDTTAVPSIVSYNMSVTQSMFEFVSTITQVGGFTGTFTNTAASTTITINSILVGNIIFLGGILILNGNTRTVVAYGTGRGQTGTYTVNTAITLANTTQSFTSTESYGYILTSFN